jgi:hypothetical protein
MKYLSLCLIAVVLSSCATTGDPSAGGLFGWSQQQYQQDMSRKQQYHSDIRADTDRINRQAASVRGQMRNY